MRSKLTWPVISRRHFECNIKAVVAVNGNHFNNA